jgi:hypothetical protein
MLRSVPFANIRHDHRAILILLITGLWAIGKLLWLAVPSCLLFLWLLVLVLKVFPPLPPDPSLVKQMEQLSFEICRDIEKHSVEFCEEEIRQMRKKIGGY